MTMEARETVIKILAETSKSLDTAVGELNLMESEAGATMAEKVSTEGGCGGGDPVITYAVAEVAKTNSKMSEKKYNRGGSGCAQDAIKNGGSGRSAHADRDEKGRAQDNRGISLDGRRSSREVGDVVGRVRVDGV